MADTGERDVRLTGLPRCKTCRFWNRARKERWLDGPGVEVEHAQCRRYAPARLLADRGSPAPDRVWPHVNATDWCGDHVPAASS